MKKKQKRNINIEDSKDKNRNNNILIKEKINEEKRLKHNKMTNSNINSKNQSIRNNAVEKLKLISTSNDKNLKQVNTESIFKTKKINNYQPISSKASSNNNNPFRSSSKGYKDNRIIKKNIPSIKKLFASNISNSFTAKERILNRSKNEEISSYSNIPESDKNKSRKKDKIILKNKNLYNIIEKTISINDSPINISELKGKEINYDNIYNIYDKYSQQYYTKKSNVSKPKKTQNINIKIIEKNEKKNIKEANIQKIKSNSKIGTDNYKDNTKSKIKINGSNKEVINEEDKNKNINNSSIVKKDDINLIIIKEDNSNKNSLKNIKETEENIEEIIKENESISEKEDNKNGKFDEMIDNDNMKSNGIEKEIYNLKDSLNNDKNNIEAIDNNITKNENSKNNNYNIIDEDKDNKEVKNQKVVEHNNLIKSNDFKIIDNYNDNEFNKEEENIENEIIDFEEEPIVQKNLEKKHDIKDCNEDNNKDNNEDKNNSNKDNNEDNNGDNNKDNNIEKYSNNYYNKKIGLNGNEENYDEEEIMNTKYLEIEEKIRKKENIITYLNNKKKKEKEGKNKYSNKNIKVKNEDNLLNNGMNKIHNYSNEKDINKNLNGNLESLYNQKYNIENVEINHMINENNLNGNDNPNENKKYSYEKNDFKFKKISKNNGVEIMNNSNNNEINKENKLNELNSIQNRIKPKYEVIDISINEKKEKKIKPKLKEKKEKNEKNKPQMPINVISSQEISPSNNLIDDIQNLIIKSKQKVENDLDKIEKIDNNSKIISIPVKKSNKNKMQKELKIKQNNSQKDIYKKINRKKLETNVRNNLNNINKPHPLNKRYDTDLSLNKKKNNNLSKSKSKNKNLNSVNESRYKKEKEIMPKKLSSQIIIKKNYMTNFLDNNIYEIKNNEKDEGSPHRPKNESTSQKKNYRNTKYDNIDLNTFFTKSSKKDDKKSYNNKNINDINTKIKEENGGIVNKYENNIIKEDEQEQEIDNKFKNKKEIRKIIISPKKYDKIKEEEINEDDKNELINMNKELINKITLLKKEVEYSKKEMRKKILNLEEELMYRKNEMDMKTKKINELMNINMGLEKEMNQLKIYYKSKEKNKNDYINSNETQKKIKDNKEKNYDFNNVEKDEENIKQYEGFEEKCSFEELSIEELHSKRNSLIKKRNEINALYNKLPIKLDDEQIAKKIELENKLKSINNDLMKIRLQLKNISQ